MNRLNKKSIFLFPLFLFASMQSFADQNTYTCVVKDVKRVSDEGLLVKPAVSVGASIGMNFIIKKKSGEVVGEYINSDGMISEVLDKGRGSNNYKVVIKKDYDRSFREISYIEVIDSYSRKTPFAFIGFRFSSTFSGTCY
ncbi:MAG: hypothetical protein WCG95_09060 [bacterium]